MIGTLTDIAGRFIGSLPTGWFPPDDPGLTAIAQAPGESLSTVYSTQTTARAVMRLSTCPGRFLDLFAADYFGLNGLPRFPGEGDEPYRARIKWNLTAPRGTRAGMTGMLTYLTGRAPIVVNPGRAADVGGYGVARGYNTLGAYGSMAMPFQAFVTAYRGTPQVQGMAFGGYGTLPASADTYVPGGYGTGAIAYGSANAISGALTDAHIYRQIAAWTPVHSVAWVRLED